MKHIHHRPSMLSNMYADFTYMSYLYHLSVKIIFFVIKWSIIIAFNIGFFLECGIYSETMS